MSLTTGMLKLLFGKHAPNNARTVIWLSLAGAVLLLHPASPAAAQDRVDSAFCGSLANGDNGPFDYRVVRGPRLVVVENHHFTPDVEALQKPESPILGANLDFTLRAFPNHHRALNALTRLGEKMKTQSPPGLPRPLECYFERAVRFRPNDTVVRMMYAIYLHKAQNGAEAVRQLTLADQMAEKDAFTHYNIGLVYLDMKKLDEARDQARKAYSLGIQIPDLRDKLKAAGKWEEGDEKAPPAADAPAKPASQ